MALAITATPNVPAAYMSLSVTGLTGYDTLTVTRTNPDGSVVAIRAANGITVASSSWADLDYECPIDGLVTYTATALTHDGGGNVTATGTASTAPTSIDVPDGTVWLKNLSQPALSRVVTVTGVDAISRPARMQTYDVINRRAPVVISDVRSARRGKISLFTADATERADLLTLLDDGQVLLLQAPYLYGYEDLYFTPEELTENRPGTPEDPARAWELGYIEVDSPAGSLTSLPDNSWLTVSSWPTWQAVLSARTSWLDVLNRPYGS